ncbi:hypothetical protein HJC99_02540 [Candidatus Saccharibacteria bacterium]|nr:hypothetical protein [Candidatus Saccharibacteria bacterium]
MFDNLSDLLGDEPSFRVHRLRDENKVSGVTKWRTIHAPNDPMRKLHSRMIVDLRLLQTKVHGRSPYATAVLPGSSPRRNVERHRGKRYLYLLDLHSAYLYVKGGELAFILCTLAAQRDGYLVADPSELSSTHDFLKRYCLGTTGGLLTGAPASPDLFNIYAGELIDQRLAPRLKRWGLTYSRYIDDLTFSSNEPIGERKRRAIRDVIAAAGFDISYRKAKVYDLAKGPVQINGIGLDLTGRTYVPRKYLGKVNGILHLARYGMIKPAKVAGYMGVYWTATPRSHQGRNRAECHTLELFHDYQLHRNDWLIRS